MSSISQSGWGLVLRYNTPNGINVSLNNKGFYTISFSAYATNDNVMLNMSLNTKDSLDLTVDHSIIVNTQSQKYAWTVDYEDADINIKDSLLKFWHTSIPDVIVVTDVQLEPGNVSTAYRSAEVTKEDIGLGNVDNTSDLDKPISSATQTALDNKVDGSQVVTTATPNKILQLNSSGQLPASITGNANSASRLSTVRAIALTGDGSGSTGFDGTGNATIVFTLDNVNSDTGTFTKVTINSKGLVTSASNITASDIPNLNWSKITTGKPITLSGYGITDGVKNSGSVPSFQSGNESSRPSATGSMLVYIATDTQKMYQDTASNVWTQIGKFDIPVATESQDGLLSSEDKTKIDGLATVATSGSYNDLIDKPSGSSLIVTDSAAPSSPSVGDYWFQVV